VVLELAGEDIPRAQVAQLRAQGAAWVTGAVAATVHEWDGNVVGYDWAVGAMLGMA